MISIHNQHGVRIHLRAKTAALQTGQIHPYEAFNIEYPELVQKRLKSLKVHTYSTIKRKKHILKSVLQVPYLGFSWMIHWFFKVIKAQIEWYEQAYEQAYKNGHYPMYFVLDPYGLWYAPYVWHEYKSEDYIGVNHEALHEKSMKMERNDKEKVYQL